MIASPLNDALYFRRQFNGLDERFSLWFETAAIVKEEDFDEELPLDDILYWYADRMNERERRRLAAMIRLWEWLARRAEREQVCFNCRKWTHEYFLKPKFIASAGDFRLFCPSCIKNWERTAQPSLFN